MSKTPGTMTVCTCAVGKVPLLLVRFGSKVEANADAIFVKKPKIKAVLVSTKLYELLPDGYEKMLLELKADGTTWTVRLVAWPLVNVVKTGHVTMPFEKIPAVDALVKTTLVGRMSRARMFDAVDGPALVISTM